MYNKLGYFTHQPRKRVDFSYSLTSLLNSLAGFVNSLICIGIFGPTNCKVSSRISSSCFALLPLILSFESWFRMICFLAISARTHHFLTAFIPVGHFQSGLHPRSIELPIDVFHLQFFAAHAAYYQPSCIFHF